MALFFMLENTIIPRLTTALTGPLQALEKIFLSRQVDIECWLRRQWRLTPALLYTSVDIRNAGFKVAPIDTNLFPAGFNNLNPDFLPLCIQAAQTTVENILPGTRKILLIPENHTRNLFYLESVVTLQQIFQQAGFIVRVGSMLEELTQAQSFTLPSGKELTLEPLSRQDDNLCIQGKGETFIADLVILNNDLSGETPAILQNIKQMITPSIHLGWASRLKSHHFDIYQQLIKEFSQELNVDPWLLMPLHRNCQEVDFMNNKGIDCLTHHAETLWQEIKAKYQQYHVPHEPYLVVKADAGSYGMGVMTIKSIDEINHLNRKQRTRMSTTKGGNEVSKVILQEGVYTFETVDNGTAEPVVYMVGSHVVGGFYRVHDQRDVTDNLNAPGATFKPLAFMKSCNMPINCDTQENNLTEQSANRFYMYGVIARLAALAAAREMQAITAQGLA